MASVKYNGDVVNSSVNNLKSISEKFPSLVDGIQRATNQIISARGFSEYVGSISGDAFSGMVQGCQSNCDNVINAIRQKQVDILAYNNDKDGINTFLDQLDRSDYDKLNLSSIDKYITLDRKAFNVLNGAWSSIQLFGLGLVEGLGEFGETGYDLLDIGQTAFKSLYTKKDQLDELWAGTRARVSEEHVKSLFDSIYSDNEHLRNLKYNAYGGESGREIGKGLGYAAGMIGLTAATGGIAGASAGVAGFGANAAQLGVTAGLMGVSKHTEEGWNSGAETFKGLQYGAAAGAWEGVQWYFGAKINALGGERVAGELIRGGNSMAAARIGLSGVDAAAEGYVQPALSMIYKDYGQGNLIDNYKVAYDQAGGAANVFKNATMGVIGGTFGELVEMGQARLASRGNEVKSIHNLEGSAEVVAAEKAREAFRQKYPELVKQYGDNFVDTIPVSKLKELTNAEHSVALSEASKMLSNNLDNSLEAGLRSTAGYKDDIVDWLRDSVGYTGTDIDDVAERMAAKIFASTNVSKLRANNLAMSGNYTEAFHLLSSVLKGGSSTSSTKEVVTELFRSMETYNNSSNTRELAFNLFKSRVNNGYDENDAANFFYDCLFDASSKRGFISKKITLGDGREATIYVPKNFRTSSNNGITLKQFEDGIANIPSALQPYAPIEYYYYDTFCPTDLIWTVDPAFSRSLGSDGTFWTAMTQYGHGDRISVWNCANDIFALNHELGHAFDSHRVLYEISNSPEWLNARNADISAGKWADITEYGSSRPTGREYSEDFAECVYYFFKNRNYLRRHCPHREQLLSRLFNM